ncbi:MAG: trypsin-like peptidase domain-containing protein [Actinomadura sp.]
MPAEMATELNTTVETSELRRYVVRLEDDHGQVVGTGFFVAPSWILTCAHVVREKIRVVAVPDQSVSVAALPASVEVRSPPPTDQSSGLWPFPDLALLHLHEPVHHPCALLDTDDGPMSGAVWQTWGFAERERGLAPEGSAASFRYEGEEGDGYLKLKSGEAAPGLSGAPLICTRRRAVVGMVAATRRLGTDMGAYAVPVARLLNSGRGIPSVLASHGKLIRDINLRTVIDDDRSWHRVLPIDGADRILRQPWTSFVRNANSRPSDLLLAEFGVVPYLFREREQREALAWCAGSAPMAIARVSGSGGAGKTRFALELCKTLSGRGWVAGFWRRDKTSVEVPLPRLIVVDYAETEELRLALGVMEDLKRSASPIAPVRVLLLTRTGTGGQLPENVQNTAAASLIAVLDTSFEIGGVGRELDHRQRNILFRESVRSFARAWDPDTETAAENLEPDELRDLSADRYASPLEVLFEALDSALAEEPPARGRLRAPVERVLEHERKYWERTGPQFAPDIRESAAALSSLAGAATDEEAHGLLEVLPALHGSGAYDERRRLIDWLAKLYSGPNVLNAVRPDRLGEELISQVVRDRPDGGQSLLEALLRLPSDSQVAQCLVVLARLVPGDATGHEVIKSALARSLEEIRRRARPDRNLQHLPNPIVSAYEQLAEAMGVVQHREGLRRKEALAETQVADERAREAKTNQSYSESVSRRDELGELGKLSMEGRPLQAIPSAAAAARERELRLLTQQIRDLEGELSAARHARRAAEDELDQLRAESADLDSLISLKEELERQLRLQVQYVRQEQRRRERADESRKQAEERGAGMQLQLETQFARAQHEAYEREKAVGSLQKIQLELQELERDWGLENAVARRERELREQLERRAKQQHGSMTELQQRLDRLQLDKEEWQGVSTGLQQRLGYLQKGRDRYAIIAVGACATAVASLIVAFILLVT